MNSSSGTPAGVGENNLGYCLSAGDLLIIHRSSEKLLRVSPQRFRSAVGSPLPASDAQIKRVGYMNFLITFSLRRKNLTKNYISSFGFAEPLNSRSFSWRQEGADDGALLPLLWDAAFANAFTVHWVVTAPLSVTACLETPRVPQERPEASECLRGRKAE